MRQFPGPGPGQHDEYCWDVLHWDGDGIMRTFGDDNATWSWQSSEG